MMLVFRFFGWLHHVGWLHYKSEVLGGVHYTDMLS